MSQSRKVYPEAIRIVAILLVIFGHSDGFIYYTVTGNRLTWLYSVMLAVVCKSAPPLFFMVSGAFLLEKEESLKTLFSKRVLRFILVLVSVSVLYYLFDVVRGRIPEAGVIDFLNRFTNKEIRDSFWFLYSYLFFLLSVPFLKKLASGMNETLIIYMICLKGICELAFPFLGEMCGLSMWVDIEIVCDYIYYGLMGYYLAHMGEKFGKKIGIKALWGCLAILIVLSIGIVQLLYWRTGSYETINLDMPRFLMAPVLWLLIRRLTESLPENSKINSLIILAGSCAFGIYLFDNFVRWQLLPVYLYLSDKTVGVFANSVYVALVFFAGGIYTWILKRIPLLGKFI